MMFSNRFVLAIKVNGKILREQQNLVTLPFGTEYEILIKNLNSKRAMVKLAVDGQDVTDGRRLILAPNAAMTIERFIRNGNMNSGNRFKFIERSEAVEKHRGIKADDGLIRAEFWAETDYVHIRNAFEPTREISVKDLADTLGVRAREVISFLLTCGIFATLNQLLDIDTASKVAKHFYSWNQPSPWPFYPTPQEPRPYPRPHVPHMDIRPRDLRPRFGGAAPSVRLSGPTASASARRSSGGIQGSSSRIGGQNASFSSFAPSGGTADAGDFQERGDMSRALMMDSFNDAGITVPGSESRQRFQDASGFPVEDKSTVIVLQLRGSVDGVVVETPVTVETKPECSICGKKNSSTSRFCDQCGAALKII